MALVQQSKANFEYQALGMDEVARDIQNIITAINAGGSGATTGDVVFVADKDDFPTAVGGVITLAANITYFLTADIDLAGDRLVGSQDTVLIGGSSENCSLTSTGLGAGVALFTTEWTTPIRHIAFKDVDTCLAGMST